MRFGDRGVRGGGEVRGLRGGDARKLGYFRIQEIPQDMKLYADRGGLEDRSGGITGKQRDYFRHWERGRVKGKE